MVKRKRAKNAPLQAALRCVTLAVRMMLARISACLILLVLSSGCATSTITNLTPSTHVRNANGLYSFEVALDSRQQSMRKETLKPYVMIGVDLFPMQPAPVLKNRWETLIPIAPDQKFVHYRYKFDFQYLTIPQRRPSSLLSAPYRLEIIDQPKQ
jgi:hypothetical protein